MVTAIVETPIAIRPKDVSILENGLRLLSNPRLEFCVRSIITEEATSSSFVK